MEFLFVCFFLLTHSSVERNSVIDIEFHFADSHMQAVLSSSK